MSLQMSRKSEELSEGNSFDGDSTPSSSSETTLSGSLAPICGIITDIFDEIDRYRKDDSTTALDLMEEVEQYRGDDSNALNRWIRKQGFLLRRLVLDDPIIATIHT